MEDLIKMAQLGTKLSQGLGMSIPLAEMVHSVNSHKLAGLRVIEDMVKKWQENDIYSRTHLTGINSIAKTFANANWNESMLGGMAFIGEMFKGINKHKIPAYRSAAHMANGPKTMIEALKFQMPINTLNAITGIGMQYEKLYNNYRSITEAVHISSALPQFTSLLWALKGISGEMASIAARNQEWNLLDDFERSSEEVVVISNRIAEQEYATKEDIENLKIHFQQITETVRTPAWVTWITIISFILALYTEAKTIVSKPDAATKSDIESLRKEIQNQAQTKLLEFKDSRTIQRKCKVSLKPKAKSHILTNLPKGYNVIVLQSFHEWLFISYVNPKDGLTETGWILKKYF